jgi:hypothetical protein
MPDLNPIAGNFKIWKKKEDDKCRLVLSTQRENNPWYIAVDVPNI